MLKPTATLIILKIFRISLPYGNSCSYGDALRDEAWCHSLMGAPHIGMALKGIVILQ